MRADEQLKMSRNALRELVTVAGTKLANIPHAEVLRGELANFVLEFYKSLINEYPDGPAILLEMARSYKLIAGLAQLSGKLQDAERAFEQSIGILNRLRPEHPHDEGAAEWLVRAMTDRGEFYHLTGRTQEAERDLQAAIEQVDSEVDDLPQIMYLELKSTALANLSEILKLHGRAAEGLAAVTDAVILLDRALGLELPGDVANRVRWVLSSALTSRGDAGQTVDEREADYRRAAAEANNIPQNSDYGTSGQLQRATALVKLGELLIAEERIGDETDAVFETAIKSMEPLEQVSKDYPYYREALARALMGRAKVRAVQKRLDQALSDCERSKRLVDELVSAQPTNREFLSHSSEVTKLASRIRGLVEKRE